MSLEMRLNEVERFFNNVKNSARNVVDNAINALFGNPVAFEKCLEAVVNSPFFIREQIFWTKFGMFLDGINLSEADRATFRAKLSENGTTQENAERFITLIDRTDTKKKIWYFINATRCLLANFITSSEYFRICDLITITLYEDLEFLGKNISSKEFEYSYFVQGLLNSGFMYQSVIDSNTGNHKYSFTALAKLVDAYAVSYDNDTRYPNPKCRNWEILSPQIDLQPRTASDEEIQEGIEAIFSKK